MTNKEIINHLKMKNVDKGVIDIISEALVYSKKNKLLNELQTYINGFIIEESIGDFNYRILCKLNYDDWDLKNLPEISIELENFGITNPLISKLISPNYKNIWKENIENDYNNIPKEIAQCIEQFKNELYSLIDEIKEFGDDYFNDSDYIFNAYNEEGIINE